jgi:peptidyl-prolyl cis-trans isomerase C
MKQLMTIVCVLVLATGTLMAKPSYEKLRSEAHELIMQEMYEQAEMLYEEALESRPPKSDRFDILIDLADLEFDKMNDPENALAHLLEAKALYSDGYRDMDRIYYRLGLVYEDLGRYVEAAKSFEAVATRFRKSPFFEDALDGVERAFKHNFREFVAVVGGEPITRLELDEAIEKIPAFYRSRFETEEGRKELLERLIDERLLVKEAEARDLYLDTEFRRGISDQRKNLLQRILYNREVKEKLEVPDSDVQAYYRSHKEDYKTQAKVTVRRIVVETEEDALNVLESLRSGESFDSLVIERSITTDAKNGGWMRNLTEDASPPEIVSRAFEMGEGDLSAPILLEDSTYAVIRVEETVPETYKALEDVRSGIESNLSKELEQTRWEDFRAELRDKYGVKYEDEIEEEIEERGFGEESTE